MHTSVHSWPAAIPDIGLVTAAMSLTVAVTGDGDRRLGQSLLPGAGSDRTKPGSLLGVVPRLASAAPSAGEFDAGSPVAAHIAD